MLFKLNNLIKDITNQTPIKQSEPKNDNAYLTKNPANHKCGSCNQNIPKLQFTERASDYQKYLAYSPY